MAPFSMTRQTLTMIGPFQTGLSKVGWIGFAAVTIFTWLNFAGGAVMMAGRAIPPHLGHPRVVLVIEMHSLIKIDQFVEKH